MKHTSHIKPFSLRIFMICFLLGMLSKASFGQSILIDNPVRAGELTVFPDVKDGNKYYYLPDKPRLALHPNGEPQFSFLRYVDNVSSEGAEDQKEGEGGGIVHAVVELNVTDDQLSEAKGALRQINPSGEIVGPVIYEGGTIALISSVANEESGFTKKVIGLGKAPILDGQKAAISILLNKNGAKILWESFNSPTPDMSFSFEMTLKGYRSPIGATIEANFDQIYTHNNFQVGAITQVGNTMLGTEINKTFDDLRKTGAIKVTSFDPDADMEKAISAAYNKLTTMMFNPANNNVGTPRNAAYGFRQPKMLDRAQMLLNQGRNNARQDIAMANAQNNSQNIGQTGNSSPLNTNSSATTASTTEDLPPITSGTSLFNPSRGYHQNRTTPKYDPNLSRPPGTRGGAGLGQQTIMPKSAILVSYTMRKVRQRGVFKIDLNKFKTDKITLRFDQNVGSINCNDCFREFNMGSDVFYQQREIAAIMDGYNASDFEKFINYVAVTFKKSHESGEVTTDEIRIDRSRFNKEGNFYKFLYGWKGDNERSQWLDYEYKTVWNFFGGASLESEWISSEVNTIPLSPPYLRKVIEVEIDKEIAKEEGIRSAEVKIFYDVEGKETVKQVRLNPRSEVSTVQVEVLEPAPYLDSNPAYTYEITWIMRSGETKKSERKTGNSLVIFADTM